MSGTLICGKTTGNAVVPVQVNADGTLEMTAEIDSSALAKESTLDSFRTENATNLGTIDSSLSDGTAVSRIMGSEDPNDVAGTQKQIHVDGSGNVQTNVVNTINIAPANTLNSGITNDPVNSVAVGLRGRQTITDASTETFLKCDASGVLEVSSSGGGGSSNTNLYPVLNSITTGINFGAGMVQSNYVELTNAKNIVINCIHTGNAVARANFVSDIALTVEFTDDSTNTVCYSGASTPVFATAGLQADGTTTGSAVAVLSFGENSEALGQITGKFLRVVAVNNDVSGTSTAFTVDFKVVVSGI